MKLVLATPLYPPDSGGPATYAKLLMDYLPTQNDHESDKVTLVEFSDVRHLPKGIRHWAYFWRVLKAGREADIIFALDPVSTGFPAMLAASILGKPFVVKIVGDFSWEQGVQRFGVMATLDEFVHQERTPFAVACLRFVQTWVARRATRIIVPSKYLKGIVLVWSKKITPERVSVIYNSVELPSLSKPVEGIHTPAMPAGLHIVSAGRLVPWKGMEGLINAIEEVRKELPTVSLTIVGDGPDKEMLTKKGKKQLGSALTFTGALPHAEALSVVRTATVYVQNSSYEGLSHQLIEALMLGKTIIATNVGGNPELIQDGVNGLLVPPIDANLNKVALINALKKLFGDAELRARLGTHARESSMTFQAPAMIEKTRTLLHSLTV